LVLTKLPLVGHCSLFLFNLFVGPFIFLDKFYQDFYHGRLHVDCFCSFTIPVYANGGAIMNYSLKNLAAVLVLVGASADFQSATQIAKLMVKMYGMSEKVSFCNCYSFLACSLFLKNFFQLWSFTCMLTMPVELLVNVLNLTV
jgi:hypothetical protein